MKALENLLAMRRLWPVWVALIALATLIPGLGSYGFWEPQEIEVAERVVERLDARGDGAGAPDEATEVAGQRGQRVPTRDDEPKEPVLTEWLAATTVDAASMSERAARLPLALLGVITVVATYFIGMRLASARAGLIAALVLLSFPLFLFQARQITSDMGAVCGGALTVLGLCGLTWPRTGKPVWELAIDGALIAFGLALGYAGAGALVGVAVPAGAVGIAGAAAAGGCVWRRLVRGASASESDDTAAEGVPDWRVLAVSVAAIALAAGAIAHLCHEVFTIVDASAGDRSLLSRTLEATDEYTHALGGTWRPEGNRAMTFNTLFVHIAAGIFPWVAIAPIAVAYLAMGRCTRRASWAGFVVFAWATAAWAVCSIVSRKVGPVTFVALPAVAVAIGLWLDQLADDRAAGKERATVLPLAALFAILAAASIGRDIITFPAQFLSLHLDDPIGDFPEGVSLYKPVAALGIGVAAILAVHLCWWRGRFAEGWLGRLANLSRWALPAALAGSTLSALILAHGWIPQLATKLSSRDMFSSFRDVREPNDALGIMGRAGAGPRFYAGGNFEELKGRGALIEFLQRPDRVFALVRGSELCPLQKESARKSFDFYVIDDSNAELMLLSNKMWSGQGVLPPSVQTLMRGVLDENPLSRSVRDTPPEHIQHPLNVNYDDRIELIGVDLPSRVSRGSSFEMTLYYKVLEPIGRNWKVFVHFDGGGMRFQGDHDPIGGRCGTSYWQAGDYIVDRFTVQAGDPAHPKTTYRVWTGFFVGSGGNWTNMEAKTGNPDGDNRVPIGSIRVD